MLNEPKIIVPDKTFFSTHITFTSVGLIKELVKILNVFMINYFTFDRTYKDGSHLRLTNAGEWIEHYYRNKLYSVAIFEKDPAID